MEGEVSVTHVALGPEVSVVPSELKLSCSVLAASAPPSITVSLYQTIDVVSKRLSTRTPSVSLVRLRSYPPRPWVEHT